MARELLLMRQGAAKRHAAEGGLHSKAKRRAQRMGIWLAQNHLIPDRIICTPNPCAIVTTTKMAKAMAFNVRNIIVDNHITETLAQQPESVERILILADQCELEPLMTTEEQLLPGDLLLLDRQGRVKRHIAAKSLPKEFPYPDIDNSELRPRPAYYYHQSAVIPYRIVDDGVMIMLITSSGGRHWVVPKGIHEPGLTAADSACKEAWEEAGIIGTITKKPLGIYHYTKWKSDCRVTVFAMQVTKLEESWQESHRKRRWCQADEAISLIHQPALIPMIRQLITQLTEER
ncbi:MAG: NUDIX domain-containing protein [Mariprofundales bacterium]|nr:NUDIX domain-containing protein [Mariprofundales bacterium]